MKKVMAYICIAVLVVVVLLFTLPIIMVKIHYARMDKAVYPHDYPNTEWVSEDGVVHLRVDDDKQVYGIVYKNDESFEIIIHIPPNSLGVVANMYPNDYNREYQFWSIKSFEDDKFVIKVYQKDEEVTIFEDRSTVTFYRVDNTSQTE